MRALRENDMEQYHKLVQEAKNERIKFLLDQTKNYLSSLGSKVKRQQQQLEKDKEAQLEQQNLPPGSASAATARGRFPPPSPSSPFSKIVWNSECKCHGSFSHGRGKSRGPAWPVSY